MEASRRIIQDANQILCVRDTKNRKIEFRRPNALDTLRLFKAAGPDLAENEAWLSMASLAFAVTSIDDVPAPQPTNEGHIESLIDKLGDEGVAAIAAALDQPPEGTNAGNLPGTQF
jgi:hypothetical protein